MSSPCPVCSDPDCQSWALRKNETWHTPPRPTPDVEAAKSIRWPDRDLNELSIEDFANELIRLKTRGDTEIGHAAADDVLCDMIRWNERVGDLDDYDADELIALYVAVPKWYA